VTPLSIHFIYLYPPSQLLNIANGVEIPLDAERNLLNCLKTGEQNIVSFCVRQFFCTETLGVELKMR
jgi:hypothetical protein